MLEYDHRSLLINQLFQLVLWIISLNGLSHVLSILRKPIPHEEDQLVLWICRAAGFAALAACFAVKSGDLSVLLLAVMVLGPLVVVRPVGENP